MSRGHARRALATSLALMLADEEIPEYISFESWWTWISVITSRLSMTIKEYEGWAVEINAMHMIECSRY